MTQQVGAGVQQACVITVGWQLVCAQHSVCVWQAGWQLDCWQQLVCWHWVWQQEVYFTFLHLYLRHRFFASASPVINANAITTITEVTIIFRIIVRHPPYESQLCESMIPELPYSRIMRILQA